jgi:dihydrofolate reductase
MAPDLILYIAISLDGFIATPEGSVDWLMAIAPPDPPSRHPDASPEDYGYGNFFASVDGLIMGRTTYEQAWELGGGTWPYPGKVSFVLTRSPADLQTPTVPHAQIEAIAHWEQVLTDHPQVQRLWLVGGGQIITLLADQITEYQIAIAPVLLGAGIPLSADPRKGGRRSLRLLDVQHWSNGMVQLHYRRSGQ